MHDLAVYLKEEILFAWDLFLENIANSYLCFQLALLHSVSYFLFLYQSTSLFLYNLLDAISFKIDEVPLINLSINVFVSQDFNVQHKDWPTYSDRTDTPCELCYNLL